MNAGKIVRWASVAVAVATITFLVSDSQGRIGNLILALTGVVILWYTWETAFLRKETHAANQREARPLLLPRFVEIHSPQNSIPKIRIALKNEGKGPARNIRWEINYLKKDNEQYSPFDHNQISGDLPILWPGHGYRLTAFKRQDYRSKNIADLKLEIIYDWEYEKKEAETFSLNLDNYVSTDVSNELLQELDNAWIEKVVVDNSGK